MADPTADKAGGANPPSHTNETHKLPPPPSPPFRTVEVAQQNWYRVHPYDKVTGNYGEGQFNDSAGGNARFSPLVLDDGRVVPTIYAASDERGAISETILHDVPTPSNGHSHDWNATQNGKSHLSIIQIGELRLANLTKMGLQAVGLRVGDLFELERIDYSITREWAKYIYSSLPEAHGLQWMSVRDNQSKAILLFGDRMSGVPITVIQPAKHISSYQGIIFQMLDELGAGLTMD